MIPLLFTTYVVYVLPPIMQSLLLFLLIWLLLSSNMATPSPFRSWATRDQRLSARILRSQGLTYPQIAAELGITQRQVQTACTRDRPSPRKLPGARPKLSADKIDDIIEFISSSKETRRMSYKILIEHLQLEVSETTLRNSLKKRGYHRCKALQKPPITERTRVRRLDWATEYVNWTREQWNKILWTDETWVTSKYHRRIYVTRKAGEEFDETCTRERHQRLGGWMFWGAFFDNQKGPSLFWEKEWGTITTQAYCERVVPLIDGIIRLWARDRYYPGGGSD